MTCGDDIHEDHTVTIGIGVSVCIVVVISVIGIILTRLYDRDKELQAYEQEYWNMTNKSLIPLHPRGANTSAPASKPETQKDEASPA